MIVGVGIDMVEVARLEASISRFGRRFLGRLFTPAEQAYCAQRAHPAQHFSARFAAKEAAAKALGTGISGGVGWLDFEVQSEPGGAPRLLLHGGAAQRAAALGGLEIVLSLTHTDTTAGAVVLFQRAVLQGNLAKME
jgi:holo-[acyl-carrier protein] synthase